MFAIVRYSYVFGIQAPTVLRYKFHSKWISPLVLRIGLKFTNLYYHSFLFEQSFSFRFCPLKTTIVDFQPWWIWRKAKCRSSLLLLGGPPKPISWIKKPTHTTRVANLFDHMAKNHDLKIFESQNFNLEYIVGCQEKHSKGVLYRSCDRRSH